MQTRSVISGAPILLCVLVFLLPERAAPAEGFTVRPLVKFAIAKTDRYPDRAYRRLVNNGGLPPERGFVYVDDADELLQVDCRSVDLFGVTYRIRHTQTTRDQYPTVVVTWSHPGIDTAGSHFRKVRRVPRVRYEPNQIMTSAFELDDRFRIDGPFTMTLSYGDDVLLVSHFELTGCADP